MDGGGCAHPKYWKKGGEDRMDGDDVLFLCVDDGDDVAMGTNWM